MSAGDPYTELVLASQRRLYAYILTLVPRLSDADDVLQETNAVLLRKRGTFQPGSAFNAWACQIAYFEALAYHRRQKRQCRIFDDELQAQLAAEAADRYGAIDRRLDALEQCIEKLTAADRQMVRMRYEEELSSEGMANRVGRTAEACRRHLFRIRTALLRCIEGRLRQRETME